MKISAINGFRSDVTFEKKPNKESIVVSRPQTSSLKAIPLAVLIAMSPLNAVQAQNKAENTNSATKTEQVKSPEEKVLQAFRIIDASPRYGDCIMELVSTDGDDEFSEKVTLTFERPNPNALSTVNDNEVLKIEELKNLARYNDKYVVEGKGKINNYIYKLYSGEHIFTKEENIDLISKEISKDFYEFLYENLKDVVPIIIDNNSSKELY